MFKALFSILFLFLIPVIGIIYFCQTWLIPNLNVYEASLSHEILNAYRIQNNAQTEHFELELTLLPVKVETLKSTVSGKIKEVFVEEGSIIDDVPFEAFQLDRSEEKLNKQLESTEEESSQSEQSKTVEESSFYILEPLKIAKVLVKPKQIISTDEEFIYYFPKKARQLKTVLPKERLSFIEEGQIIEIESGFKNLYKAHYKGTVTKINPKNYEVIINLPIETAFVDFPEKASFTSSFEYNITTPQVKIPKSALVYDNDQIIVYIFQQHPQKPGYYNVSKQAVSINQFIENEWVTLKTNLKRGTLIASDVNDKKNLPDSTKTYRIQYDLRYYDKKIRNWY